MRPSRIRITTAAGDVTITPSAVTAIAKSIDPVVILGDVTITPSAVTAIAKSIDPVVIAGPVAEHDAALMFGMNF